MVGDPPVVVDEQQRPGRRREHVLGRAAQPAQRLLVVPPQPGLGQLGGGVDQGDEGGVQGQGGPADVDDAEQGAGARVVHGGCRAVPRVLPLLEVLGREQLHRSLFGERGADGVGADVVLGPGRALGEPERVSPAEHAGRPVAPEDGAVGVGDHHDEPRRVGDRREHRPDLVDDQGQRRGPSPPLDLDPRERVAGIGAGGVEPERQRPRPRPRDERSGARRGLGTAHHGVVHPLQGPGVLAQVGARATALPACDVIVDSSHPGGRGDVPVGVAPVGRAAPAVQCRAALPRAAGVGCDRVRGSTSPRRARRSTP